jgi:hypothetical protein
MYGKDRSLEEVADKAPPLPALKLEEQRMSGVK